MHLANSFPEDGTLVYLLHRISEGDEPALATLYDLTSKRTYAISLKILRSEELAEEATLDGYTKIWRQARKFDRSMGGARVWIDTLVRNSALDLLRKEKRRPRSEEIRETVYGEHRFDDPDFFPKSFELNQHVQLIMTVLTEDQRQAILAAYYGGMSHREIAEALDQPLGTIKTRIRTALTLLRQELGKLGGAPS